MSAPRILVLACIFLAACAGTESSEGRTSTTLTATTTTEQPTTTAVQQPTTTATTLPGEVIDFGPVAGDTLMVIGVRHDDVLNVRAAPGVDYEIVATLAPYNLEVQALGETRQIPGAFWIAVEVEGTSGWVNLRHVGYEGSTDDLTHVVVEQIGYPTADTMTELGLVVAQTLASEDPPSEIVVVVAETVGDLGEVTYDIIGLGDDAVRGLRAHVFGQASDEVFGLKSVEVTTICARGVTDDGLCP